MLTLCSIALALVLGTANSANAQVVQAEYPLLTDLDDAAGNFGPVTLSGTPPPALPTNGSGVCHNGIYIFSGNPLGQDIITDTISTLDDTDFELEVEFQVAALTGTSRPILIGGNGWRWIGMQVDSNGNFGVLYNNANSEFSTTPITVGTWHTGVLKFEAGTVELYLDGAQVLQSVIGVLDSGPMDLDFTTTNYSNGQVLDGCIRRLKISNDTTLGVMPGGNIGTNYCMAQPNSVGLIGTMSAAGSSSVSANNLTLTASELPANQFGIFVTSMTQAFTPGAGGTSNGNLCVGGSIGRYSQPNQILNTGSSGSFDLAVDTTMTPQGAGFVAISAGETWYFQSWYRDPVGVGSNFTDGLEITFN